MILPAYSLGCYLMVSCWAWRPSVCVIIRRFPVVKAFVGFRAGQVVQNPAPLAVACNL